MHIGLVSHSSDHRANPKDTRIQGARVTASVVVSAVLKDHAGTGGCQSADSEVQTDGHTDVDIDKSGEYSHGAT